MALPVLLASAVPVLQECDITFVTDSLWTLLLRFVVRRWLVIKSCFCFWFYTNLTVSGLSSIKRHCRNVTRPLEIPFKQSPKVVVKSLSTGDMRSEPQYLYALSRGTCCFCEPGKRRWKRRQLRCEKLQQLCLQSPWCIHFQFDVVVQLSNNS